MTFIAAPRRRGLLAAGLALATAGLPAAARAQVAEWEFFEPRPREYSRIRREPPPTMAIEFGGQRPDARQTWPKLDAAAQAAVRAIQPGPLADADEPAYPRLGLKPLVERLRVVRGPLGQPLRLYLQVSELGAAQRLAIDGKVSDLFGRQMLGLLETAAFKPGTCDGKACTRVFAMDLVYLGEGD